MTNNYLKNNNLTSITQMKKQILLGLVCIGIAGGCKKKNDDVTPQPGDKQLTSTVTTLNGQSVTYQLVYDGKNRLTEYNSVEDQYRSKVTYDDRDNPVKFEVISDETTQIFDVKYGENGVPVSAVQKLFATQTPGDVSETRITYELSGGKISKMKIADADGTAYSYLLTYSGNNLTRVVNDAGELLLGWKHGSKKSAYSSARFQHPVIPDLLPLFSSENEIVEMTVVLPEYGPVSFKEEYQYDTDGYPTSSVMKDEAGNIIRKVDYRYR